MYKVIQIEWLYDVKKAILDGISENMMFLVKIVKYCDINNTDEYKIGYDVIKVYVWPSAITVRQH